MAWVLGVGMVDPRNGMTLNDRQPMAIVQSWGPTSELWWQLGLRWHPELATKWAVGGGQFSVCEIVDEEPAPEPAFEEQCEEVLDMIAESQPGFVEEIRRIRDGGSEAEKQTAVSELRKNMVDMMKIAKYVEGTK